MKLLSKLRFRSRWKPISASNYYDVSFGHPGLPYTRVLYMNAHGKLKTRVIKGHFSSDLNSPHEVPLDEVREHELFLSVDRTLDPGFGGFQVTVNGTKMNLPELKQRTGCETAITAADIDRVAETSPGVWEIKVDAPFGGGLYRRERSGVWRALRLNNGFA